MKRNFGVTSFLLGERGHVSETRVPSFVLGVLLSSAVGSGFAGTRRDTCCADPGLRLHM
jgi:hypothetical protein